MLWSEIIGSGIVTTQQRNLYEFSRNLIVVFRMKHKRSRRRWNVVSKNFHWETRKMHTLCNTSMVYVSCCMCYCMLSNTSNNDNRTWSLYLIDTYATRRRIVVYAARGCSRCTPLSWAIYSWPYDRLRNTSPWPPDLRNHPSLTYFSTRRSGTFLVELQADKRL